MGQGLHDTAGWKANQVVPALIQSVGVRGVVLRRADWQPLECTTVRPMATRRWREGRGALLVSARGPAVVLQVMPAVDWRFLNTRCGRVVACVYGRRVG